MSFLGCLTLLACHDGRQNAYQELDAALVSLDDSIKHFSPRALALIDSGIAAATDSLTYYSYYERKAKYYYLTTTPDSMLPYIERTLDFCRRNEPSPQLQVVKGMALESKAVYYQHFRQQSDSVIILHQQAYEALRGSNHVIPLISLTANLGDAYALKNNLPEAAHCYRHAIYLADSLQADIEVKTSLYLGLGHIYVCLKDYDSAAAYYKMVNEHYDVLPPNLKFYFLNNYGNYFYFRHDYPQALRQFEQLKQLLEQTGVSDGFDMQLCKLNMADVYLNLGRLEESKQCLDQVQPFFEQHHVEAAIYYVHSIRIGLAAQTGQRLQLQQLFESERDFAAPEPGMKDIRYKYLGNYYEAMGQTAEALRILKELDLIQDSATMSREHMQTIEHMMLLSEDTIRLHQQLAIEEQKVETRTAYVFVLVLVAVILLLMLYYYMMNRRRRLQTERDMLRLRLANVRNRISPHFVFNVINRHISRVGKAEENELMKLVDLIRANLSVSGNTLITLREELEFVRHYVDVEQQGMDFTFEVEGPGDEELSRILLPSMFVQILVENAVKHGLRGIDRQGHLLIKVDAREQETEIVVADNGRGFDYRAVTGNSTGIGLTILRQTIAIFNEYNRHHMDFQIHNITNNEGQTQGCEATLLIPREIRIIDHKTMDYEKN